MKARIDNMVLEIDVIKMNYNEHTAKVVIKEGNCKGYYAIVDYKDLIDNSKSTEKSKRKLKFNNCSINYYPTTRMFMGDYVHGWKAIYNGYLLASETTKAECKKKARKEFNRLVKQGEIK